MTPSDYTELLHLQRIFTELCPSEVPFSDAEDDQAFPQVGVGTLPPGGGLVAGVVPDVVREVHPSRRYFAKFLHEENLDQEPPGSGSVRLTENPNFVDSGGRTQGAAQASAAAFSSTRESRV